MHGLELIEKTREYCDYLEEHLLNVQWAWKKLQEDCKDMRFIYDDYVHGTIDGMIQEHDLSKLGVVEFVPYRQKFYPVEGEMTNIFDQAWEHHKENNLHHWESWAHLKFFNPYEWECHCVCMVCDWMAMGKKFGDTAEAYYEKNKDKIKVPDYAVKMMYEIFDRLKPKEKE